MLCSRGGNLINLLSNVNGVFEKKIMNILLKKLKSPRKIYSWGLETSDLHNLIRLKTNWEAFEEILFSFQRKTKPEAKYIVFKHPKINNLISKFPKFFHNKKLSLMILIRLKSYFFIK